MRSLGKCVIKCVIGKDGKEYGGVQSKKDGGRERERERERANPERERGR